MMMKTWSTIQQTQGSVSHLDFLTDLEKDVFKQLSNLISSGLSN
jgi:ribonucleoside-diphosphate reductase alpha chain